MMASLRQAERGTKKFGTFDESKVKRGQPENKGQFAPKEGGSEAEKGEPQEEEGATSKDSASHEEAVSQWAGNLSSQERAALSDFTGDGYKEIKQHQRGQKKPNAAQKKRLAALDSAIESAPASPGTYYRGMVVSDQSCRYDDE